MTENQPRQEKYKIDFDAPKSILKAPTKNQTHTKPIPLKYQ